MNKKEAGAVNIKHDGNRAIPELLAPAGGMKQLIAAVENGADAVYLGGPLFNARIHADNFTEEQIKEAVDYAHLRNVKIYITLNILLTNEELLPALQYAGKLYEMGADGLILQDLGLADLVKTWLPDFPLHLSTQASVYNLSGVKKAEKMGFQRVVLARELALEEIRAITGETSCPVEVFAHGALCMCYSGQCQLSRALGDGSRSGNRGLCAQPCRLSYRWGAGKAGYILSPKDLCTISCLGELAEAGIASLKIEGRMKFPEYVAAVTAIYRKYLDQYAKEGTCIVSQEDWHILNQIFNRGGFTTGYLYGNPGQKLLSGTLPKHQGVYMGKVVAGVKSAGYPGKSSLIDVKLEKNLNMGDGVEIRSRELTGNIITYLKPLDRKKGNIVRIGDIKGSVRPGDPVYRISNAKLMKELRDTYEQGGPQGKRHRKRVPVQMEFQAKTGQYPRLIIREGSFELAVTDHEEAVQWAKNHPLTEEAVVRQLVKTGGSPFMPEYIKTDIEENSSLPLSAINRLRRKALAELAGKKTETQRRTAVELPARIFTDSEEKRQEKHLAFYFFEVKHLSRGIEKLKQTAQYLGADKSSLRAYVPLRFFMEEQLWEESSQTVEKGLDQSVAFIPYILNISKGSLDQYIEEHLEEIADKTGQTGISIGNLSWIDEFLSRGVPVYADYGLNLYNRQAKKAIEKQGVRFRTMSLESLEGKNSWRGGCGSIPLMILEHPIRLQRFQDRKEQGYKIVYNMENDKAMIFFDNSEPDLEKIRKRWEKEEGEIRIYMI